MDMYREIMDKSQKHLEKFVRDNRLVVQAKIYSEDYIEETIMESFKELREKIQAEIHEEKEKIEKRMEEMEEENMLILPKSSSLEELLRRQEIELEISLMDDESFKEYAEKVLTEDHHHFDEMRLFTELRNRGQELAMDTVKSIREDRLRDNPEYQELHRQKTMYDVFSGFSSEVGYETADGKVVYNDLDKLKEMIYSEKPVSANSFQ